MAEYAKALPAELRNKSQVGSASVHQDLQIPIAGPSHTANFRSSTSKSEKSSLDTDFQAFIEAQGINGEGSKEPTASSSAASVIASSWSGQDLAPRDGDGGAVLELLGRAGNLEDLDESLDELDARRQQRWQVEADNTIPQDPVPSASLHSDEAGPYLSNLLSLSDGQSMQSYLNSTSYTDDVWGLPMSLKQDLDRAKGIDGTTPDAREKALRRLEMLKDHLRHKADSQGGDQHAAPFSAQDWEKIWSLHQG